MTIHSPPTSPIVTPCTTRPPSPILVQPFSLPSPAAINSPPVSPTTDLSRQGLLALPNELLFQIISHLCEWTTQDAPWGQRPHEDVTTTASLRSLYHLALTCRQLQPLALLGLIRHWRRNATRSDGTLLHWVLRQGCGNGALVKLLIDTIGCNVNEWDNKYVRPLICCITWGDNPDVVRTLIDHKADMTVTDNAGLTPLHLAVLWGRWESLEVLLAKGANAEAATDIQGSTAMHYAASVWSLEHAKRAVKVLHRHGGSLSRPNTQKVSPVVVAARRGDAAKELLEMMLSLDPDQAVTSYRNGVMTGLCEPITMLGARRESVENPERPEEIKIVGIGSDGKVQGRWRGWRLTDGC